MATASPILPPARDTHSIAVGYLCWLLGFLGMHRFYYGKPDHRHDLVLHRRPAS